eukprot:gnl/TRDRNA2_/TRDRNA2_41247_c0_seq1.p2 gnl/TRDRNA2_/TRDRNA2_41247_c0~~gnl/TRDRNA2_/TRDRNA2_41247_c0_seq1.p2  ORF type:complete len:104 (+),score=23.36 gnl/TRDRNA2_/TRDRNA2_41247_c0_seq1:1-312(+)
MARGGRHVVFGFTAGGVDPKQAFPNFPINLLLMKGQQILGAMGAGGNPMPQLLQMVEDGKLKPLVGRSYQMADFTQAFADLATRKSIGKVVVTVNAGMLPSKL